MNNLLFRKGTEVLYAPKAHLDEKQKSLRKCKVIYIFKAYKIPKAKKVVKYYGEKIISPMYGRVFGPMKNDRIVLKCGKNDYIVLHCDLKLFNYANLEIIKY